MPCDSSYLEPSNAERDSKHVAHLILFVRARLREFMPKKKYEEFVAGYISVTDLREIERDSYGDPNKLDELVCELCRTCKFLDDPDKAPEYHSILFNGRERNSRQLADWWEEHQRADCARIKKETNAQLRKSALAKLTTRERKALGVETEAEIAAEKRTLIR